MKFTLSWLKEHLETKASVEEIADCLTRIGLEVEEVDKREDLSSLRIGRVVSASPHPNADRLKILEVDAGGGKVQVICGAPNAKEGLVGVFAAPGTYLPGLDITISKASIRDVESCGMMCSERELQLGDDHDGIIELPSNAPVGENYAQYAGLSDPVFDVAITPNRGDALSVAGIAIDLAASGIGKIKTKPVKKIKGEKKCPVDVKLHFPEGDSLCPAFGLRLIRGVKNVPSPQWLQQRLRSIGLRPISALVDITNYITYDRGRPLHVFDAAKVKGNLIVRRAEEKEKFTALDAKTYQPGIDACVIADEKEIASLSGIIGGEKSGCSEKTTDVLVESALWDPLNIARTGRRLGIDSDARYRFERGVDPLFMEDGLDLATALILDLCGGKPTEKLITGKIPENKNSILFPLSEIPRLTGAKVPASRVIDILSSLGFESKKKNENQLTVSIPLRRSDILGKADLVEEVMRIEGVDSIEPQALPPMNTVGAKILTPQQIQDKNTGRALAARGMVEAVSYSFIESAHAKIFGEKGELTLENPIASDLAVMRPSLLPGLLSIAKRNADHGYPDLAAFEVGNVYCDPTPEGQKRHAAAIRTATAKFENSARHWRQKEQTVDLHDAKEDALSALAACGVKVENLSISTPAPDWFHPGRSGIITMGPKNILGAFGEFHPNVLREIDVNGAICGFEINLDAIPIPKQRKTSKGHLELHPLQSVKRDFAFVVDTALPANDVIKAAKKTDTKHITAVRLFDLFEGKTLGENKKSLAIEVTMQPVGKSFTDAEIDKISNSVIESVTKLGATLRA